MLPNNGNMEDLISEVQEEQEKTQTFGLNINKSIVGGKVDGIDSLTQSIYLMLSIEADRYIIYPYTYGLTTSDLIGKPSYYVIAILPDRIKETLLSDNRIIDITDFEFEVDKNKIHAKFIVHTVYGDVEHETEVNI